MRYGGQYQDGGSGSEDGWIRRGTRRLASRSEGPTARACWSSCLGNSTPARPRIPLGGSGWCVEFRAGDLCRSLRGDFPRRAVRPGVGGSLPSSWRPPGVAQPFLAGHGQLRPATSKAGSLPAPEGHPPIGGNFKSAPRALARRWRCEFGDDSFEGERVGWRIDGCDEGTLGGRT